jgi:pyruvyltransferase
LLFQTLIDIIIGDKASFSISPQYKERIKMSSGRFVTNMNRKVHFLLQYLTRNWVRNNDYDLGNGLKLFYWKLSPNSENLGDYLSKVVVSHFIPKGSNLLSPKKHKTIYSIGSIIGFRCQNAVVWGSGILNAHKSRKKNVCHSKLDVRAVRGPKTRQVLLDWGISCPEVYGDPAILMPLIYKPKSTEKKYPVSIVLHYEHNQFDIPEDQDIHLIDICTTNYKQFIDEISQSSLVISSSLHGIILAETYGVPAVPLLKRDAIVFKFEDWYLSTGRDNIVIARNVEEALSLQPMALPELSGMQEQLLRAFPADLWDTL